MTERESPETWAIPSFLEMYPHPTKVIEPICSSRKIPCVRSYFTQPEYIYPRIKCHFISLFVTDRRKEGERIE